MAYTSWSVVFGEQPSAAKWNILGTNDASFNDGTGIADGAITNAKLGTTAYYDAGDSTGDLSTSYVSTATLTLPAGTYLLISTGNGVFSVAQYTQITGRLRNTTAGSDITSGTFAGSYVSGTISARPATALSAVVTFGVTTQVDAEFLLNSGSGSGYVTANLIAIPVGTV